MQSYHVHNFGCRASAADGDSIAAALEREGGLEAGTLEGAGVVVVNTCAVTAEAERSARALIRRVRRVNPGARVVVTGCYAQRAPGEVRGLPGVDAVVGNSHKGAVARVALGGVEGHSLAGGSAGFVPVSRLTERLHTPFGERWVSGVFAGEHGMESELPIATGGARTRPILKVQDGCGIGARFV